jgi:hypothetical protein
MQMIRTKRYENSVCSYKMKSDYGQKLLPHSAFTSHTSYKEFTTNSMMQSRWEDDR